MGHKKKKVTAVTKAPGKKKAKKVVPAWPTDLEYIKLFDDCDIKKEKLAEVDKVIDDSIVANRSRYETVVAQASGVGLSGSLFDMPGLGGNLLNPSIPGFNVPGFNTGTMGNFAAQGTSLARNLQSAESLAGGVSSGINTASAVGGVAGAFNTTTTAAGTINTLSGPGNIFSGNGLGGNGLGNGFTGNGITGLQSGLMGPFGFQFGSGRTIPWYFVAVTHYMECSSDFKKHLHNGDPLTGYTTHVPANRPQVGHAPPFTWEESAVDALKLEKLDKVTNWSLGAMLHRIEAYNGAGYKNRSMNSPYLWSYSNQYTKGKFAADGKFDAELVSKQVGAAVLLKRMEDRGIIYIPRA